jgi:hypothetical protein
MSPKLLFFILLLLPCAYLSAKDDSICGAVLKYQVLASTEPTDGFFWTAGDRKYNVYYKGADIILENKKKHELWLISGASFNPYAGTEMYIDTIYFKNTSESPEKELVIGYTLYSMKPDDSGKSRHLMIMDIRDKMILLNIATYEQALRKDENGKYSEYLYECDVDLFYNSIRITTSDDSDIDNAATQLDDGVYVRKGHCFVRHK